MTNDQVIQGWQAAEACCRSTSAVGISNGEYMMNEMLTFDSNCPECGKGIGRIAWDEDEFLGRCGYCNSNSNVYEISPFREAFQVLLARRRGRSTGLGKSVEDIVRAGLLLAVPMDNGDNDLDAALNKIEENGVTNILVDDPDDLQALKLFLKNQVAVAEWFYTEDDEWGDFMWIRAYKK